MNITLNRRTTARRRGSSLVEVLIVITTLSVLLAAAMMTAQILLRADRGGKSGLAEMRRLDELADRFRDDAHWSERAELALPSSPLAPPAQAPGPVQPPPSASPPSASAKTPSQAQTPSYDGGMDFARGDRIVEYRIQGDAIERIVREGMERRGREVFVMSGHPRIEFQIERPNSERRDLGMATLILQRKQGLEQEGRLSTIRVEAAVAQRGRRNP